MMIQKLKCGLILMGGVFCLGFLSCASPSGGDAVIKGVGPNTSLVIVVEDPFVTDSEAAARLRHLPCSSTGAEKALPGIQIFVEGGCVLSGRLKCMGKAVDHRYFARIYYALDEGTEEVPVEIILPSLKIHHQQTVLTKDGVYLYVYHDEGQNKIILKQSLRPYWNE